MLLGKVYLRPVRYFSLTDAIRLIQMVSLALIVGFLFILKEHRGTGYSLLPLTFFLVMPFMALIRVFTRIRWEKEKANQIETSKKIAVYGAGRGGVALANWLNNGFLVGFLDDDPILSGKYVCGCRVMGRERDLPTVHEVHRFDELWVTFRPDESKKKRLEKACKQRGVELFIIPELEPFTRFVSFGDQTTGGAKKP